MKNLFIISIILFNIWVLNAQEHKETINIKDVFDVCFLDSAKMQYGAPLINGKLIIPPYGSEYCYIAETGKKLKYTDLEDLKKIKELATSNFVLYKTDSYNIIFDLYSGKEIYKSNYYREPNRSRVPLISQNCLIKSDYVFFAKSLRTMVCIDSKSLQELWQFEAETEMYDYVIENKGVCYFGSSNYLYAIDIKSGKELWKLDIGKVITNSVIKGDTLYTCVFKKGIVAININSGEAIYEQKYALNVRKIEIVDSIIYYVDNTLFAFNRTDGKLVFYIKDYESCINTDAYFIYKDHIFTKNWIENQCILEAFNRKSGKKTHEFVPDTTDILVNEFLFEAAQFSISYKNMIYTVSMRESVNGIFYAKIYGARIKDEILYGK